MATNRRAGHDPPFRMSLDMNELLPAGQALRLRVTAEVAEFMLPFGRGYCDTYAICLDNEVVSGDIRSSAYGCAAFLGNVGST